ncbi:MAG TPA: phosphate ABC transporter permease subunit PstC [Candidatus Krumholzibacteriaceae bacterium]|nr:phosphate ABC transporter permease subunit PstC [Candidatus Krumholzibacteriaceae bacterium]
MDRDRVDRYSYRVMKGLTLASVSLVFVIAFMLFLKSVPILRSAFIVDLLFDSSWFPLRGEFGFYPFIVGTVMVTVTAMALACPVCILSAIYLSEYASLRVRGVVKPLIDLLAGIPSVIFGLWGVSYVVPGIRNVVAPWFGVSTTGYCVLSAGVVLAIMVFPIIISVSEEVLRAVPFEARESSFVLGATRWETVKHVVMRRASTGILSAVLLGFSRAFGETMAVLMVVGNTPQVPGSLFDAGYTLPSLIANNYGEMMSLPLYDSALMFAALILMVLVGGFSLLARVTQRRITRWTS